VNESQFNIDNLKLNLCPACGAPLDFAAGSSTIHCNYCNNNFTVPENHSNENISSLRNLQNREFVNYLKSGDKVNAVILYRKMTNSSLQQADKIVEKLLSQFFKPPVGQNPALKKPGSAILFIVILSIIIAISGLVLFIVFKH